MAVALAEVRKVCTAAEVALVKLSRPPAVGKLSAAEARRLAIRARKAFDKWQDQKRSQAREKSRETGFGEAAERTALKMEIFRDALASFEQQAARGEAGAAAAKGTPKAKRAAGHRAERAATRDQLKEIKHGKNRRPLPKSAAKPKADDAAPAGEEAAADEAQTSSAGSGTITRRVRKKAILTGAVDGAASNERHLRQPSQVQARTVAKKARLLESGVKTRIRGHVSAQGKRAQARRDSKPK